MADVTRQSVNRCLSNAPICWQAFQESICHCLQKYCLNYSTALLYLDSLKPREDFGSYVKVVRSSPRVANCVSACVCVCQSGGKDAMYLDSATGSGVPSIRERTRCDIAG